MRKLLYGLIVAGSLIGLSGCYVGRPYATPYYGYYYRYPRYYGYYPGYYYRRPYYGYGYGGYGYLSPHERWEHRHGIP